MKSHTTAILLSALLGFVGADRMYLGHGGLGLGKLVSSLFVLGILWWLVDIVLVATKGTSGLKAVNWKAAGESYHAGA